MDTESINLQMSSVDLINLELLAIQIKIYVDTHN